MPTPENTQVDVAFAYFNSQQNTSGVTTWFKDLLGHWHLDRHSVAVELMEIGISSIITPLLKTILDRPIPCTSLGSPYTTQHGVLKHLHFLNRVRPKVFAPQCLIDAHFAANYASQFGLKWIFAIHSDDPVYWSLADQCGPSKEEGVWVAVSEHIAEIARNRYPHAAIEVIPYGVEVPQNAVRWNPERFRVIYSGRITEQQKRISKVIDRLIEFCHRVPHGDAVLLGNGDGLEAMQNRVREEGLSERIQFRGYLTPTEVSHELSQAQAILLQSDFEGLPIAMLEGMAHGLVPVARYINSGVPELVKHDETGCMTGDEDAADHLERLASAPEIWHHLSKKARSLIQNQYSKASCLDRWQTVIGDLSKTSSPQYPFPIPNPFPLAEVDARLSHFDQRTIHWKTFLKYHIKNLYLKFAR